MKKWNKILISGCALVLCAGLMTACMSNGVMPTPTPQQTETPDAVNPPNAGDEDNPVFFTETSETYRTLYAQNPIEDAFAEDFANAMSAEDFDKLAAAYSDAWEKEFNALYQVLDAAAPDEDTRVELQGLYDYTVESAQAAYEENRNTFTYTDENGVEQSGQTPEYLALFAQAELYKTNTVLMILNDYPGDTPYAFAYKKQ